MTRQLVCWAFFLCLSTQVTAFSSSTYSKASWDYYPDSALSLIRLDHGFYLPGLDELTPAVTNSLIRTASFVDPRLIQDYGIDWLGLAVWPSAWLVRGFQTRWSEGPSLYEWPDLLALAVPIVVNALTHPRLSVAVEAVEAGLGWDTELFWAGHQALVWSPFLDFNLHLRPGLWLGVRGSWTACLGTGYLPDRLQNRWAVGVIVGWDALAPSR